MPKIIATVIGQGSIAQYSTQPHLLDSGAAAEIDLANPVSPSTLLRVRALIDSGASGTCIDNTLVRKLNLPQTSWISFRTSNMPQTTRMPQHQVNVTLPNTVFFPQLLVTAIDLTGIGYDCLIGRDILSRAEFFYNGFVGAYSLQFR